MTEIFKVICKKCAEKKDTCCDYNKLFLVKGEVEKIKNFKPDLKYKKYGSGFYLVRKQGGKRFKCQFLTDRGCSLPKELKPLDCLSFPLVMIYNNGDCEMYLNKDCPELKSIPEEWIKETKEQVLERLNRWLEEEKRDYSKVVESIPKKNLIRV